MMRDTFVRYGQLLAIEGPPAVVSAQLSLLPKTSDIHIIPSIETYLHERASRGGAFNARRYIRQVQDALGARYGEALEFLCKPGYPGLKRLVFLDGGICSAHALCISAIKHNLTNGNLSRAGMLFEEIMRDAMEDATEGMPTSSLGSSIPVSYMYDRYLGSICQEEEMEGIDPVTRAMRKADALYERTASLDLSDLSIPEQSTATEMPLAAPTARTSRTLRISRSSYLSQISSTLQTPDTSNIEYGEARIVQIQPAIPTTLKRVKSADRWYTKAERKSAYGAPLTPPRSYSTPRGFQTDDVLTPDTSILTLQGITPPLSHDAIGDPGSPRLRSIASATQPHQPLQAAQDQVPSKCSRHLIQHQEDLIISLADAHSDPVLQYATDNLLYNGLPVHFCVANRPMQGVPNDVDRTLTERQPEVKTQNALRSLLTDLIPACHDYDHSLFTEIGDTDPPQENIAEMSVEMQPVYDLVLAVGGQDVVQKELYHRITGELQSLGHRTQETRSMRLDLRHLIASAMQSHTSQPLASQTKTNPFTDPFLLAHLLVTELKQALIACTKARYIILDFTAQHLPIVFAMRSIVGQDTFKIASLVNDEQLFHEFKKRRNRNRAFNITNPPTHPPFSPCPPASTSLAEADFLLSSSSGEAEEALFINAIWKHLIQLDDFYAPKPHTPEFDDARLLPLSGSSPASPRNVRFHVPYVPNPDSPPESPPGRTDHQQAVPPSPRYTVFPPAHQHQAARPVSPDSTIASRGSSRSKTNRSAKIGRSGRTGGVVGNGVKRSLSKLFSRRKTPARGPVLQPAGLVGLRSVDNIGFETRRDGEDDVDVEERRFLPLLDRSRVYESSGGSAKALRMLGIS